MIYISRKKRKKVTVLMFFFYISAKYSKVFLYNFSHAGSANDSLCQRLMNVPPTAFTWAMRLQISGKDSSGESDR